SFLYPLTMYGQTDWNAVKINTINITDNISYLNGRGGNIGVLYGVDGVMIVDDQYAELSDKIKKSLDSLSKNDLKFIVNTHYHGDHVGGNENLSKNGASIVAHQNVRKRLGITFYSSMWEREVESKPETFWPVITFNDEITFYFNEEEVQIIHIPKAHTDGDALIYFKTSNIMHTGDGFVRYGYPFIDVSAGGSIDGMIAAQEKILEVADANTKIIPGHGGISSVDHVKELLNMLKETRKIIADLKTAGKSLDECITSKPLEQYHKRWSGSFINSDLFVSLIYESMK
ncbi:MAG: MBL fold metallo-hydrolase, partial [Cyclobacteriaceae bacterium]|nr:MBL fold metallo-hydrolase [Cyclobacteriaceae bacterium]